jgi:hypothetical protein
MFRFWWREPVPQQARFLQKAKKYFDFNKKDIGKTWLQRKGG